MYSENKTKKVIDGNLAINPRELGKSCLELQTD